MSDNAREVLEAPGWLREALRELYEKRERIRSMCQRLTARYGLTRVNGGNNGVADAAQVWLAEANSEIAQAQEALVRAQARADTLLSRLADLPGRTSRRDAALLRLRYLEGLSWEGVRAALAKQGYPIGSSRGLRNWHYQAMEHAQQSLGIDGEMGE